MLERVWVCLVRGRAWAREEPATCCVAGSEASVMRREHLVAGCGFYRKEGV